MKKQLNQLRRFFARTGTRKLNAATVREVIPASYDDDESSNRLSGAFIVVLALHVIALVGVFAFSRMKDPKPNDMLRSSGSAGQSLTEQTASTPSNAAQLPTPEPLPTPAPQYASLQGVKPSAVATSETLGATERNTDVPLRAPARIAGRIHVVKSGENLTRIAFAHGVQAADVVTANNLRNDEIRPGQELVIPESKPPTVKGSSKPAVAKASQPTSYKVRKNDTLVKIARDLGVRYNDLTKINGIKDPKKLQEGQVLKVPKKS